MPQQPPQNAGSGQNLMSNAFANCTPSEYNTTRLRRSTYEPSALVVVSPRPAYVIDIAVKLNPTFTPPTNCMVAIIDMTCGPQSTPVATSIDSLAALYAMGGAVLAFSDTKTAGGIFGYSPPIEWQTEVEGKGLLSIGRRFQQGLAVALVDPSDESFVADTNVITIDARIIFLSSNACP